MYLAVYRHPLIVAIVDYSSVLKIIDALTIFSPFLPLHDSESLNALFRVSSSKLAIAILAIPIIDAVTNLSFF